MKNLNKKIFNGLILTFTFLSIFSANAKESNASNYKFSKTYKVTVRGVSAGKAKLKIDLSDKNYTVKLKLKPNLMAKALGAPNLTEKVTGIISSKKNRNTLIPKDYSRVDGSKLIFSAKFTKKNIHVVDKKKKRSSNVKNKLGIQDPLTQIIQVQQDLLMSNIAKKYEIVTGKSTTVYNAKKKKLKNGYLVTLTQAVSAKRVVKLKFNNAFELVKVTKIRKGRVDFILK